MTNLGENIQFATSQEEVDKINKEFYEKIKYPWAPLAFEKIMRPDFWSKMLSQDLGYFNQNVFPQNSTIWVAGCGTNQAIFTALKFPEAHIIGSDLSKESLSICQKNAEDLKVGNIELRCESINTIDYCNMFDYIICTGVIHHNSNPSLALQALAKALKKDGIIELMVYNKFHRLTTSAFQLAIRLLVNSGIVPRLDKEIPIARMIMKSFKNKNLMGGLLESLEGVPDAAFADALLQPVEHSYTIESLDKIASEANLEVLSFCMDQFSCSKNNFTWNIEFEDHNLQILYDSLTDTKRWQISNLLLGEESPMLWFYFQKKDSTRRRKTEKQMCVDFLNTKFKRVNLQKKLYILRDNDSYNEDPMIVRFPSQKIWVSEDVKKVYFNLNEKSCISETLEKCGMEPMFTTVNKLRSCLTTSAFPHLEAYQ